MERLDAHVGSTKRTLKQGPEILQAVGVNLPADVGDRMVNDAVDILGVESVVRLEGVGVDLGATPDVLAHLGLEPSLAGVLHDGCPDGAMRIAVRSLEHAHDGD